MNRKINVKLKNGEIRNLRFDSAKGAEIPIMDIFESIGLQLKYAGIQFSDISSIEFAEKTREEIRIEYSFVGDKEHSEKALWKKQ